MCEVWTWCVTSGAAGFIIKSTFAAHPRETCSFFQTSAVTTAHCAQGAGDSASRLGRPVKDSQSWLLPGVRVPPGMCFA